MSEFTKFSQTFKVARKLSTWDKFIDLITFRRRSAIQEIEVNFLFNASVDPEDVDVILSGVCITESKVMRKTMEDF